MTPNQPVLGILLLKLKDKGYLMNTQLKSAAKFIKVLLTAVMLVSLVYGFFPARQARASSFLINDLGDDPDPSLDGICDISPGDGVDNCTLRAALMEANRVDDIDVISFNVPMTLYPASAYPTITQPVTIDATSSGGRVTLNGGGNAILGLNIASSNVVVRGLALVNFDNTAIRVSGSANGVVIDNNYLGVAADGVTDGGNTGNGLNVVDSPNVQITGNLISGNDAGGILVSGAASDGVIITGNTIGLNAAGEARVENTPTTGQDGIRLTDVTNAVVGGSASSERNVVSGNYGNGIVVTGISTGTQISGNYIGTSAIGEDGVPNLTSGIRLNSADGVSIGAIRGNLISGNDAAGIVVANSANGTITDNIIGLDVDGDTALPNTSYGINVTGSSSFEISDNTISGNIGSGIRLANGVTGFNLHSNRIGLGAYSNIDLGNTNHGMYIDNSYDNTIGNTSTSLGNIIAYNDAKGIYILNTNFPTYNSYGNTIIGNQIYSNGDLGIDLAPSGPTVNDTDDPDDGPNYLQNYITFTAKKTDTGVMITGQLNTDAARPNYRIEFFRNSVCDGSGFGEGATRVDVYNLSISASTTAIDYEIPVTSIDPGEYITATVTYDEGTGGLKDTSEFSPCAVVQEPDSPGSSGVFVVNSTADTAEGGGEVGDGQCNVGGGVCTLRAAIQEANAGAAPPYTISFNIAGTAPHRISLTSALPAIGVPVLIKGKNAGYSGPPVIEIDGSGAGGANGFVVDEPSVQIDGLSMINFSSASAILLNTTGTTVSNNYLGLQADGVTTAGNQVGVTINGQTGNLIRNNVVSGNLYGVRLVGSGSQDNTVRNNYIGTDSGGTLDKGNSSDGVRLEGAPNNLIEDNTISGNGGDGIEISGGATGNRIFSNNIGTYANGSGSLGNSANGVNINTASDNFVSDSNLIRNNGGSGVYVASGTGNLISENSITANAVIGIMLASGGNANTPAPQLISASNGGSYILVEGQISGALPNTAYTLEFFRNTSGGQGETYIFTSTVTTDGSGFASFTAGPPVSVPDLTIITATATDPANNTSQFSNYVLVVGSAPVLTNTPTFTPTMTLTPSPTSNFRPTWTYTPTPTNTPAPGSATNTPQPTNTTAPTSTSSGGGSNPTASVNTATPTLTPSLTYTPTLLGPYMTLTALAANNTVEPTSTPVTPTSTLVPSPTRVPATNTPTATLVPTDTLDEGDGAVDPSLDGTGGGAEPAGDDLIGDLLSGGGGSFSTILWIFIGLAVLLLLVGGGMELMRWLNSRGD